MSVVGSQRGHGEAWTLLPQSVYFHVFASASAPLTSTPTAWWDWSWPVDLLSHIDPAVACVQLTE